MPGSGGPLGFLNESLIYEGGYSFEINTLFWVLRTLLTERACLWKIALDIPYPLVFIQVHAWNHLDESGELPPSKIYSLQRTTHSQYIASADTESIGNAIPSTCNINQPTWTQTRLVILSGTIEFSHEHRLPLTPLQTILHQRNPQWQQLLRHHSPHGFHTFFI